MTNTTVNEEVLTRLSKLEAAVFGSPEQRVRKESSPKSRTLPEIVRGATVQNGQRKVALIVGYCEHELGLEAVTPDVIRSTWRQAKFDGGYAPILLSRAIKDGYVSDYGKKGAYVLTRTGEDLYQSLTQ